MFFMLYNVLPILIVGVTPFPISHFVRLVVVGLLIIINSLQGMKVTLLCSYWSTYFPFLYIQTKDISSNAILLVEESL